MDIFTKMQSHNSGTSQFINPLTPLQGRFPLTLNLDVDKNQRMGKLKDQAKSKFTKKKMQKSEIGGSCNKNSVLIKELKKKIRKVKKGKRREREFEEKMSLSPFEAKEANQRIKRFQNKTERNRRSGGFSKKGKPGRTHGRNDRSFEKNSKSKNKKYLRMGKERYALTKNISKLVRQNVKENSQEKTLKLPWKSMEKKALEEKKRMMEIFNETIRRKNKKQAGSSQNKKSKSAGTKPWGFDQRKLRGDKKGRKGKSMKNELCKHLARLSDKERRKQIGADFLNRMNSFELRKMMRNNKVKSSFLKSPLLHDNSRLREKSFDEKKAIDEFKKRQKAKLKTQVKRAKKMNRVDREKIRYNLMRLDEKTKKARVSKKPRKSKSSSELLSESRLKRILSKSDSIPSLGENEELLYQEYKNMMMHTKSRQIFENKVISNESRGSGDKAKFVNIGLRLSLHKKGKGSKNEKIKKYIGINTNFIKLFSSKNKIRNSVDIDQLFSIHNKKSRGKKKRDKSRNGSNNLTRFRLVIRCIERSRQNRKSQNFSKKHQIFNNKSRKNRERRKKRKRKSRKFARNFTNEMMNTKEKEVINHEILLPQISDSDYLLKKGSNRLETSKNDTHSMYTKTDERKKELIDNAHNYKTFQPNQGEFDSNADISKERIEDSDSSEDESFINSLDNDEFEEEKEEGYNRVESRLERDRKAALDRLNLSRRESSGPLSKKCINQWMDILHELKSLDKNTKIDKDLKIILTQFCEKTSNDLEKLVGSTQRNGQSRIEKSSITEEKARDLSSLSKFRNEENDNSHKKMALLHNSICEKESNKNSTSRSNLSLGRRKPNLDLDIQKINQEYGIEKKAMDEDKVKLSERIRDKRTLKSSFEWLRREFDQNVEDFKKLVCDDKLKSLQEMKSMLERNESMSNVFELRERAIEQRYLAQKKLVEEVSKQDPESTKRRVELEKKLEIWYMAEREILFEEKKKITKGWLTSIEAIRRIKRDIEIADNVKFGSTYKRKILLGEDLNIFNVINRSQCSPTSTILSLTGKMSPMISPSLKKITMKSNIISDPNMRKLKLPKAKQPRKLENKSGKRISIKEKTKVAPLESIQFKPNEAKVDSLHSTVKWKGSPFGSPPAHAHPSENSSNLYNLTPTTFKGRPRGSSTWKKSERKSLMIEKDKIAKRDTSPLFDTNYNVEERNDEEEESEDPFDELEKLGEELEQEDEQERNLGKEIEEVREVEVEHSNYSGSDFGIDFSNHDNDFIESDDSQKMDETPTKENVLSDVNVSTEQKFREEGLGREFDFIDDDDGQRIEEFEQEMSEDGANREDTIKPFEGKFKPQIKNLNNIQSNTIEIKDAGSDDDEIDIDFEDLDNVLPGSVEEIIGETIDSGNPVSEDHFDGIRDNEGNIIGGSLINLGTDTLVRRQFTYDDFDNLTIPSSDREEKKPLTKKSVLNKVNLISDDVLEMIFSDVIEDIVQLLDNDTNQLSEEGDDGAIEDKIIIREKMPKNLPGIKSQAITDQIYVEDGTTNIPGGKGKELNIIEGDRRGIRVNFNAVKDYLSILCNFVKSLKGDEKNEILDKITSPYGLTILEKMALFREDYDENEGNISSARASQRAVLNFEIYLRLEEDLTLMNNNDDRFKQELEHIHNKMLFDSFNEALDSLRPYDLKGCPFPWRANAGRLKTIKKDEKGVPELLDKAQERVLDWAMFMCGFIPEKEDSMLGEIMIEEDYLNQIKEDRLIKMLTCEAFETDERWLIYDDEEVEVQTEVAELVFDHLLEEVISDLGFINKGEKVPIRKPHLETSITQLQNLEELRYNENELIQDPESDIRQLDGNSSKFRTDKKASKDSKDNSKDNLYSIKDGFQDNQIIQNSAEFESLKEGSSFIDDDFEYGIDDVNDFDNL